MDQTTRLANSRMQVARLHNALRAAMTDPDRKVTEQTIQALALSEGESFGEDVLVLAEYCHENNGAEIRAAADRLLEALK